MAHGIYWTNISNLDGDPNLSDAEIRISNKGFVMAVGTTVVVGAGVYVGLEAVAAYGTATVVTTVAAEVLGESTDALIAEVCPELAGIPLSPSDMLEYGVKKVSKSLAKEGIEVTEDVTGTVAKKVVPDAATGTVAKKASSTNNGIVYLRIDEADVIKPYVGQAKSDLRFLRRQGEHRRANRDADFRFFELDRGDPNGTFPTDLDIKEQKWLDSYDGPTNKSNPTGGTSNKKNVRKKQKEK